MRRVDEVWVKMDYLFKRFGLWDIYDKFQQEFFISTVGWEIHKAIVFMVSFLSIMIFPKKKVVSTSTYFLWSSSYLEDLLEWPSYPWSW